MSTRPRFHLNVVGPFYVEDGCCTLCGIPGAEAPDLFAEAESHCYVRRQPVTAEEHERMFSAIACADLECIRYAGDDPAQLEQLALRGAAGVCDAMPPHIAARRRDHVSFYAPSSSSARDLLARFAEPSRASSPRRLAGDADLATLTYTGSPMTLTLERVRPADRWLLRGAPGYGSEGLTALLGCTAVRWYSREEWEAGGAGHPTPW